MGVSILAGRLGFWQLMTGENRSRPFEDYSEMLRDDILRNLSNVLNARRGRIVAQEDFGLDDIEDLGGSPVKMADCIRRLVLRFEPRIDAEGLRVSPTKSSGQSMIHDGIFRQAFVVDGKMLLPKGKSRPIHIRTTVVSEAAQIEGRVETADEDDSQRLHPRRVLVEPEDRP